MHVCVRVHFITCLFPNIIHVLIILMAFPRERTIMQVSLAVHYHRGTYMLYVMSCFEVWEYHDLFTDEYTSGIIRE